VTTGLVVLAVALVAALGLGLWRAASDGRFRGTHGVRAPSGPPPAEAAGTAGAGMPAAADSVVTGTPYDGRLGERATLLQFSSAFCAPCRATRRVLEDVALVVPGVSHVEVDAEHHLDLVRRLGILRTPTTLVLDPHGREVSRALGVPRRDQVLTALDQAGSSR
jgi:thiol-disulfide isomerase/thioredoxin